MIPESWFSFWNEMGEASRSAKIGMGWDRGIVGGKKRGLNCDYYDLERYF